MVPNDPATSSDYQIPPDLARVIRVWERLPKSTKKRIMTIIDCAKRIHGRRLPMAAYPKRSMTGPQIAFTVQGRLM